MQLLFSLNIGDALVDHLDAAHSVRFCLGQWNSRASGQLVVQKAIMIYTMYVGSFSLQASDVQSFFAHI